MYISIDKPNTVISFPKREIGRPLLRDERDDVASEASLKRLLSVSWLQLQYYGVATKSLFSNRFHTIKYHQLPAPYNQLELIQHSKYYMVDLIDYDGSILGNNIYRLGGDGLPDIFDESIARVAMVDANKVNINDQFDWIVNATDVLPYPLFPRHLRHQFHTKSTGLIQPIKTEWR